MKAAAELHLTQARENPRLYEQLQSEGTYYDWALTLLFYTALHLIQAYLVEATRTGFDIPKGHEDRGTYAGRVLSREAYGAYRLLETQSRWARYEPSRDKPTLIELESIHNSFFEVIVNEMTGKGVSLR